MTRSRGWVYTLNNPTDQDQKSLEDYITEYHVFTLEIGESGTPHLQGYFEFKSPKSFATLKKAFPTCHFEPRKGTKYEAANYCLKTGDPTYESGTRPAPPAQSPTDRIRELTSAGHSKRDIIESGANLRDLNYYDAIRDVLEPQRTTAPTVHWFYGPSGSGKTTTAYAECSSHDYYCLPSNPKWWPGYDRHTHVIIDELRDQLSLHYILRLLDFLPLKVEIKGGHVSMVAEHIYITTLYSPTAWINKYAPSEPPEQLLRRIDDLRQFTIIPGFETTSTN